MKNKPQQNIKKSQKYVNILGINVLSTTEEEVLTGIEQKITDNVKFSILTPNPELVLASKKNLMLKQALNNADFSVPDGVGISYASKFLYGMSLNIIPGRILFEDLIKLSSRNGWKVFLLGGMGNEARLTAKNLLSTNPKLKVQFAGGREVTPNLQKEIVNKVNKFSPDLLFVALGNPNQEIFTAKYLPRLNVRGVMAVGGTFRYISGLSKLPPKWMESLGLEWFWRLITEPRRIKRIFSASVLFPLRIFWFKITNY